MDNNTVKESRERKSEYGSFCMAIYLGYSS
jgi:hypothetical protein